ncbi:hypothetical protein [Streptomyces rhizosphaerihabitans]|uniref:hypothetical protein n=1 Tax=Streptomyces rhizosphaerihabitans TaxID=1266770 RepID=UPI0021C1D9F6|nr:hypothetical protein [Streptomyces rhizosphaerihabitans]MCT9010480.1 hypothetical protein [Streptomyces rhizosphaerihabitans]
MAAQQQPGALAGRLPRKDRSSIHSAVQRDLANRFAGVLLFCFGHDQPPQVIGKVRSLE